MNSLAKYLEETRTSQAAFAARIGVTAGRVSHLVGGATPSAELAVRIEAESEGAVPVECWGLEVEWNRDATGAVTGYTVPVKAA